MRNTESLRLVVAFGAVYLIWGSTYLAIGVAVQTVPPVFMVVMRGALAGGALYLFSRFRGGPAVTAREMVESIPTAALLFGGGYVLVGWAEQSVASGPAALLNATVPAFVVVLEWLSGRRARPGLRVVGGLVTGLLGVSVLVFLRGQGAGGVGALGAVLLLTASLAWAFGSVRAGARAAGDPVRRAAVQLLTSAFLLLPISVLLGEHRVVLSGAIDTRSLLALCYLIVFGSLIGYTAYVWLLQHVPAGKAASHAYVNPLIAVLLGGWLGGEPLDEVTALSATLIALSVVAIVRGESTRQSVAGASEPRATWTWRKTASMLRE